MIAADRAKAARRVLDSLQAAQVRLHEQLEATGLTSFVDRSDWIIAHRTADEQLVWDRKWAAVEQVRRVHGGHAPTPESPCHRCGVLRAVRVGRGTGLCRDCMFVLSREEIELWKAA
jgi:hypothetical protein